MNTETGPACSDCRLNLWKHFLVYFSLLHSFPAKKALKTLKSIEIRCPEQGGRKKRNDVGKKTHPYQPRVQYFVIISLRS